MKYLLSTGEVTYKFEDYILDLIKIYTQIYPGDIPGALDYGFNFVMTDITKEGLRTEVTNRIQELILKIKNRFTATGLKINLTSVVVIDEEHVKVTIDINNTTSGEITVNVLN